MVSCIQSGLPSGEKKNIFLTDEQNAITILQLQWYNLLSYLLLPFCSLYKYKFYYFRDKKRGRNRSLLSELFALILLPFKFDAIFIICVHILLSEINICMCIIYTYTKSITWKMFYSWYIYNILARMIPCIYIFSSSHCRNTTYVDDAR